MLQLTSFFKLEESIQLFADVQFLERRLDLAFELHDPQNLVHQGLLDRHLVPSKLLRSHNLWKDTCFEMFWSAKNQIKYWELNVTSEGAWNIYEFNDYRSPQPPKETSDWHIKEFHCNQTRLSLQLESVVPIGPLDINLCAILKFNSGDITYWSYQHSSEKPDFHIRQNFNISKGTQK